jgi:DNA repair exonuclease SbcCD nuclease subunit
MKENYFLCIGDPHFKLDNIDDTRQFISNLDKYLSAHEEIDYIVVMGDVLHTHEKLHTVALNIAVDFFKMLVSHERNIYCLVGNHDATSNTIFLTTNHWMNILKGWDYLTIVDYPIKVEIQNSFVVMCPYVPEGRFIEALDKVEDWKDASIIFGHQTINGAKMGMIVAKDIDEWKDCYPILISGHIHDKQIIGDNVYYTGSSLQHSFGEGSDKSLTKFNFRKDIKIEEFEEVYLEIKKKKIIYADVSELDEIQEKLKDEVEYKIVLSGNESEFKALKNSTLYKETIGLDNVKDIKFKTKINKKENEIQNEEHQDDDFCKCLEGLVIKSEDPYLISIFEHLLYGKEDISDKDVLFM